MAQLNINQTKLEYVERGAGDPVVLVHGSSSDHRTWHAQLPDFSVRYRTIAYSRRYHWPNEPIPTDVDYSMQEHVADLQTLLRSLCTTPAHLVGHSYGAFVCLLLAMREPGLVRSLILAEPPAITLFVSNSPTPAEILRLALTRPRTAAALVKFGALGMAPATAAARRGDMEGAMRISGHAILGRRAYRRLSPARLEQASANAIRAEFVGSGFATLEDEGVRAVETPTLLVSGHDSPRLFHRLLDRLEELLRDTERKDIPRASHIMHEDNAAAYNAAALAFLTAH